MKKISGIAFLLLFILAVISICRDQKAAPSRPVDECFAGELLTLTRGDFIADIAGYVSIVEKVVPNRKILVTYPLLGAMVPMWSETKYLAQIPVQTRIIRKESPDWPETAKCWALGHPLALK